MGKVKKIVFLVVGIVLLVFLFSYTNSVSLIAQEKEGDIGDVSEMDIEDLLEVEITTAGKQAEKISDIPASVVVITRADVERYGYTTLDEILVNIPGMYEIDDLSFVRSIFGVRSNWSQNANTFIYLVNGVRQEPATTDGLVYPVPYIPVEAIDRIEVVRGPMSVIYGSGAFFGAINIFTDQASENNLVSLVSASYGSEETVRVTARASGTANDFKFVMNAGYYDTYGPNESLSRMVSDVSALSVFDIDTTNDSTDGRLEGTRKYFNLNVDFKGFFAKINFNQSNTDCYLVFPATGPGCEGSRTFGSYSFGYKKELSRKFTLSGNINYRKNAGRADWDFFVKNLYGSDFFGDERFEVELNSFFNLSKYQITFGLYYQNMSEKWIQTMIPGMTIYREGLDGPKKTYALFTQITYKASEKLRFVVGARLEKIEKYDVFYDVEPTFDAEPSSYKITGEYDQDKWEVIPRIALVYSINDKNVVKFLYGRAINQPPIWNTISQILLGRPSLSPEFIDTFELNYIGALSNKFNINLSVFYNRFSNLVVGQGYFDDEGNFIVPSTNAGERSTIGLEAGVQLKPIDNFILELSGMFQKSEDKTAGFEGVDVAYSPKVLAYLKASYAFSKNGNFAITGRYVGEMFPHWDVGKVNPDGSLGGRIGMDVDGYFIMDAHLRFNNLFNKGYYISIRCSNLLGEKYLYPVVTTNQEWADLGFIGKNRLLMVTIGKKF